MKGKIEAQDLTFQTSTTRQRKHVRRSNWIALSPLLSCSHIDVLMKTDIRFSSSNNSDNAGALFHEMIRMCFMKISL